MIPKAQKAYEDTLEKMEDVDTGPFMEILEPLIRKSIAEGGFVAFAQPVDPLVAEKAAIELEAKGYYVSVSNSNQMIGVGDGTYKPAALVYVNWKNMPPNTRDKHTL